MKFRILTAVLALALLFAGMVQAAPPPANGAATFDMMLYSGGDWGGEPYAADQNPWHAFFEAPTITDDFPGFTYTDTQDIGQLGNFDMLYIVQADIDALSPGDMAIVQSWVAAGGSVVIGDTNQGVSEFGAFLGASYNFTGTSDPDGNTIVNVDPNHPLNNFPNVLGPVELSDWGSSVHGALSSVGSAYTCISSDTDGDLTLPVMCAGTLGGGTIVIMGYDPECGCHDDHLASPANTNSGSEQLENLVWFAINGPQVARPVPTLTSWSLMVTVLLLGLLGVGAARRFS